MIYIFGDSHASTNFKYLNLNYEHKICFEGGVTMHRISRDRQIINFDNTFNNENNIFVLCYGEVDCRCHIGKQILLGRNLEDICNSLVNGYIDVIKTNITKYHKIIICSIIPPMKKELYEKNHHDFPFIGTDNERVIYTKLMNKLLKDQCDTNQFIFLDIYDYYSNEDGTLNYELSDKCVHIEDNAYIHYKLSEILE
jgi:hypothetical protein